MKNMLEMRISRLEKLLSKSNNRSRKFESDDFSNGPVKNGDVPLTLLECEEIKQTVEDYLDDLPEIKVNINDDNSDYGYIKVGLYNPTYVTDYDIVVSRADYTKVIHRNKTIGTVDSLDSAAELLAKDFMKDYIDGKYRS
jgi:hypothetical protein